MQQYVELYRKMNEILGMFASDLKKKKMLLSIYFVLHFAREHSDWKSKINFDITLNSRTNSIYQFFLQWYFQGNLQCQMNIAHKNNINILTIKDI